MEEEAPSRRSVAELAGRFKGSAPPHDSAENQADKPVRRRPPRSLQIPKPPVDDQESADGTSPVPTIAKRNSALIEKLQAQLVLSPTAKVPSPKSPGFRLLPPAFTPPSPGSTPVTTSSKATPTSPVTTSPVTEEERPVSFEDPLTVTDASILPSINKSRARHSLKRRPPSRRHRKSSSGDEVGVTSDVADTTLSSVNEPGEKTSTGGGDEEGEKEVGAEVFEEETKTDEVKEDTTDASTCPEKNKEDQSKTEPRGEDEKEEEEEENRSSSERKEEEEKESEEKQKEVSSSEVTDNKEEEKSEESMSQS